MWELIQTIPFPTQSVLSYSNGKFVVFGEIDSQQLNSGSYRGKVYYSTDLTITGWTQSSLDLQGNNSLMIYGDNNGFIVGCLEGIYKSSDCITWNASNLQQINTQNFRIRLNSIFLSGNTYVVCLDKSGVVCSSSDCVNWTQNLLLPITNKNHNLMCTYCQNNNTLYFNMGSDSIYYTNNLITYDSFNSPLSGDCTDNFIYGGGIYVVTNYLNNASSTDLVNWTYGTNPVLFTGKIHYYNNIFYISGNNGIYESSNGNDWTLTQSLTSPSYFDDIIQVGQMIYVKSGSNIFKKDGGIIQFEIIQFDINNTQLDGLTYFEIEYDYNWDYNFGLFGVSPGDGLETLYQTTDQQENRALNYDYMSGCDINIVYPSNQQWSVKILYQPIGEYDTANFVRNNIWRVFLCDLKIVGNLNLSLLTNVNKLFISYASITSISLPTTCFSESFFFEFELVSQIEEIDTSKYVFSEDITNIEFSFVGCSDLITIKLPDGPINEIRIANNPILTNIELGIGADYKSVVIGGTQYLTNITNFNYTKPIKNFDISYSPSLGYFNIVELFPNLTNISGDEHMSAIYRFQSNNYNIATVNQILFDLDFISVSGYSYREISITGNVPPDSSSGGIDGISAKNSLISKGFDVLTDY